MTERDVELEPIVRSLVLPELGGFEIAEIVWKISSGTAVDVGDDILELVSTTNERRMLIATACGAVMPEVNGSLTSKNLVSTVHIGTIACSNPADCPSGDVIALAWKDGGDDEARHPSSQSTRNPVESDPSRPETPEQGEVIDVIKHDEEQEPPIISVTPGERLGLAFIGVSVIVLPAIAVITLAAYLVLRLAPLVIVSILCWTSLALVLWVGRLCLAEAGSRRLGRSHAENPA